MKNYFVYMLFCFDGTFYVGITNDVERRVAEHNLGISQKSYTFTRRPVRLVHSSAFSDVEAAIAWEKHLKGWSHRKKRALAAGDWESVRRFCRSAGAGETVPQDPSTGSG